MATDLGKVGMVDKGNYNSGSTYEAMDVVTYNSSTYIAIQNVPVNTAPTNTTYWREAFINAIIGNSNISNVAASLTAAVGNTALPSEYGSSISDVLSHGMLFNYVGVSVDSGQNERLPYFDFAANDMPLGYYLCHLYHSNFGMLMAVAIISYHPVNGILSIVSSKIPNTNTDYFSVDADNSSKLNAISVSWFADFRVYQIKIA